MYLWRGFAKGISYDDNVTYEDISEFFVTTESLEERALEKWTQYFEESEKGYFQEWSVGIERIQYKTL